MSQQLQEDTAQQDAIIRSALDCIINMDHEGRIVEFNPMGRTDIRLYPGGRHRPLIGRYHHSAHATRGTHHGHAALPGEVARARSLGSRVEVNAMRSDRTEFPVEMAISATWINEKTTIYRLFTRHHRTAGIRGSAKTGKAACRRSGPGKNRVSFANMSHEIRTPMNAVLGLLSLLNEEETLNKQQQSWVKTAHQSSSMLLKLINDTLDFSKIDAGKLVLETNSFELHALINTILNMLGPKAETKGIRLTSRLEK